MKTNKTIVCGFLAAIFTLAFATLSLTGCPNDPDTGTPGLEFTLINGDTEYSVRAGTVDSGAVIIPANYKGKPVTEIGDNAFYYKTKITRITIPASVTSISGSAFSSCSSLTSINVDSGNPHYTSKGGILYNKTKTSVIAAPGAISGAVTILESVTEIGGYAFYHCSSLTEITIPAGVTDIGKSAFSSCRSLTSITIPAGVTSISYGTFWNCSRLTEITIPEGVTSIGDNAFYNCSRLTEITIPSGVTSIGSGAFLGCGSLTNITIPAGVTTIGAGAFGFWTASQTIYVRGYASESEAKRAWGTYWNRHYSDGNIEIDAKIVYLGGN